MLKDYLNQIQHSINHENTSGEQYNSFSDNLLLSYVHGNLNKVVNVAPLPKKQLAENSSYGAADGNKNING